MEGYDLEFNALAGVDLDDEPSQLDDYPVVDANTSLLNNNPFDVDF